MPWESIKNLLKMAVREDKKEEIGNENWQGKLLRAIWNGEDLNQQDCFPWLMGRKDAPTIPGILV